MSPLTDDERAKMGAVIDQMKADGASHEDIMAFIPKAQQRLQTMRLEARHQQAQTGIATAKQEEAHETGPGAYVDAAWQNTKERLGGMWEGAKALVRSGLHPYDTVTDPSKRRELLRGVDDMVTLGYGKRAAAALDEALPAALRTDLPESERVAMGWERSPLPSGLRETEQADAAAAPGYRAGGQIVGGFVPGAGSTIAHGAARAAGAVARRAGGIVASAPVRAALTYELAAPTIAAAHADSEGDRLGALLQTATDPTNLLAAAGTGAAVDRINASRGAQARRYIEERGGKVGVLSPGRGGPFNDELAGVPANDRGIGQAARIGAEEIMQGVQEKHVRETMRPYKETKAAIDASPAADAVRDVSPLVDTMHAAIGDLETAPQARSALREQLGLLERFRADPADPESPILLPERQLNGLRRTLMRAAKVGASDVVGEKEAPLRQAAFIAKKMVDEGPYAELNRNYAEGAERLKTTRRQLGLKPKPSADSNVDTKKVKLSLEREGQNTKTAGGDAQLDAFRAANPELARQADLAELARARADLAFRLVPQHGGLIERTVGATLGPGAAIAAGAAAGGPAGIATGLGTLALQNASPIAGRLLYPLARGAIEEGGAVNPVLSAKAAERERARRRAEIFRRRSAP